MGKCFDSLLGHVIGDAMGTPVEYYMRKDLQDNKITDMMGDIGQHKEPVGSWSDDTSMELALIDSIINLKTIDYNDIMNNFSLWMENGKYTPMGHAFGIGRGCLKAVYNFKKGTEPLLCGTIEENYSSNGSLMRILPIALYAYKKNLNNNEIKELVKNISSLTHRQECVIFACYIYVLYIIDLLNGISKEDAYKKLRERKYDYSSNILNVYHRLIDEDIRTLSVDDIKSSGYIVDTIEASFWCLLNNDSFEDTIIAAINLGQDTDTIAAIAGSMAGIIYGFDNIPSRWVDKLQKKDYLFDTFNRFIDVIENN